MDNIIKKKISYSLKGRKKSATTRKRISQALKGRKLSEEHKKRIGQSMRKKCISVPINQQPTNTPLRK